MKNMKFLGIALIFIISFLSSGLLPLTSHAASRFCDHDRDGYEGSGFDFDGTACDYIDCNDGDSSINPGVTETCDGTDSNCSGDEDDASDALTWYADSDTDGYGDPSSTSVACNLPSRYTSDASDCDDTDSSINPGASESCNGVDDDCDGNLDNGFSTINYYTDNDGDTYGDLASATASCVALSGYVTSSTDCDDTNAAVNPAATELCNGVDDDCNDTVDDGLASTTYYLDADSDGYGLASSTDVACSQPSSYVTNDTDCNDSNASISPAISEIADDGIDQNCDGSDLDTIPSTETSCDDLVDNDEDGETDCDDSNCTADSACDDDGSISTDGDDGSISTDGDDGSISTDGDDGSISTDGDDGSISTDGDDGSISTDDDGSSDDDDPTTNSSTDDGSSSSSRRGGSGGCTLNPHAATSMSPWILFPLILLQSVGVLRIVRENQARKNQLKS